MNQTSPSILGSLVLLVTISFTAHADVTLHALFSENAVLQQRIEVPIWGTATVGEKVTVHFQKQTVTTSATNGEWKVTLEALQPGGPFTLEVRGANTITRTNVLVGEVWVCSGQSNMQWPLSGSDTAQAAITNAADPLLRLITIPNTHAEMPQRDVKASWVASTPGTVPNFSGVAYFFGRDLRKARNVPVGLIHSSWGGSPAETWTPRGYFESDPILKPIIQAYDRSAQSYPQQLTEYKQAEAELLKKHEEAVAKAKAEGKQQPPPPKPPGDPANNAHRPCALYNAMIAPLQPFAIRGAIWYQGESNAGRAWEYRALFPAMIRAWRETWGQGDFPFLFVQLAPCGSPAEGVSRWAELREAQLWTSQNVPKTGMAVITDAGNCADIHPKQKEPVGARLALAARAVAYGEHIVSSGPVYQSMRIEGDRTTLTFQSVGGGLVAKDGELKGFIVAGADQRFCPAKAEIKGKTVVVWSPDVAQPVAVRYGWADCPAVNLYNKEGLPATPFRTDDFPMMTKPK